jgi:UDP-N-acetylmuramate dehydrogenase
MTFQENTDLRQYSTMRLGGKAKYSCTIKSKLDIKTAVQFAKENNLKILVIGRGSNVIWADQGFDGLLIINRVEFIKERVSEKYHFIEVGGGYSWDNFVELTTNKNLTGIEAMSLIPGTVGATPIQNVGAYGQEVSETIDSIEAYDLKESSFVTIKNSQANFGYRTSRFKNEDSKRFIISSVTFKLSELSPNLPLYPSVQNYFDDNHIKSINPKTIRQAVIAIRKTKLPDPEKVSNNGSFFQNPVISADHFIKLEKIFENMPYWQTKDGKYKIPAAWLIENAGLKGFYDEKTGMATSDKQAVVFINKHAKSTNDLISFRDYISHQILDKYNIKLDQEPEILP